MLEDAGPVPAYPEIRRCLESLALAAKPQDGTKQAPEQREIGTSQGLNSL